MVEHYHYRSWASYCCNKAKVVNALQIGNWRGNEASLLLSNPSTNQQARQYNLSNIAVADGAQRRRQRRSVIYHRDADDRDIVMMTMMMMMLLLMTLAAAAAALMLHNHLQ